MTELRFFWNMRSPAQRRLVNGDLIIMTMSSLGNVLSPRLAYENEHVFTFLLLITVCISALAPVSRVGLDFCFPISMLSHYLSTLPFGVDVHDYYFAISCTQSEFWPRPTMTLPPFSD